MGHISTSSEGYILVEGIFYSKESIIYNGYLEKFQSNITETKILTLNS